MLNILLFSSLILMFSLSMHSWIGIVRFSFLLTADFALAAKKQKEQEKMTRNCISMSSDHVEQRCKSVYVRCVTRGIISDFSFQSGLIMDRENRMRWIFVHTQCDPSFIRAWKFSINLLIHCCYSGEKFDLSSRQPSGTFNQLLENYLDDSIHVLFTSYLVSCDFS